MLCYWSRKDEKSKLMWVWWSANTAGRFVWHFGDFTNLHPLIINVIITISNAQGRCIADFHASLPAFNFLQSKKGEGIASWSWVLGALLPTIFSHLHIGNLSIKTSWIFHVVVNPLCWLGFRTFTEEIASVAMMNGLHYFGVSREMAIAGIWSAIQFRCVAGLF